MLASVENGTYSYQLNFVTNGSEWFARGDIVTLYDIAVPGTLAEVSIPGEPDFLEKSVQLLGNTPPDLVGAEGVLDDPSLLNLTIHSNVIPSNTPGVIQNINITIAGATDEIRAEIFTSVTTLNVGGSLSQLGAAPVPALVPEPAAGGTATILLGLTSSRPRAWR